MEADRLDILGVGSPLLGLDLLKVAFHRASRTVKESRKRRLSSSVTEDLFWVMRAVRALRHHDAYPLRSLDYCELFKGEDWPRGRGRSGLVPLRRD